MKLATLILPDADNSGASLRDMHSCLRADLCEHFGGYTATQGNGGFRCQNGRVMHEAVTVYSVAIPVETEQAARESYRKLKTIAEHYATLAEQESVMLVYPDGTVAFIAPYSAMNALTSMLQPAKLAA